MSNSNANVADFEERIRLAETDPKNELFVREHLAACVGRCPYPVLAEVGRLIAAMRRAELKAEAEGN